ncbi:MAG TPA: AraC family transcriptional regulator [Woeseiaceae bacterium]|nr:AraC family transcriptional regulator [Woeseiaceae bacterium]
MRTCCAAVQLKRVPALHLRPFVRSVWLSERRPLRGAIEAEREHVLPTGDMHLVFRLSDDPVRLFDRGAETPHMVLGHAVVGGPRSGYYVKDVPRSACSVGVQLKAGAAEALFGIPASEFAERHVRLEDLWGRPASLIRDQLIEAGDPVRQLHLLEAVIAERLPRLRALHPAVAAALEHFATSNSVGDAVRRSGYSHRGFVALFRRSVGLSPKRYARVLRFQRVLARAGKRDVTWADLALQAGYCDQAHFSREFREFAGVSPENYRRAGPTASHHLPLASTSR